jgi:hypothetical protein
MAWVALFGTVSFGVSVDAHKVVGEKERGSRRFLRECKIGRTQTSTGSRLEGPVAEGTVFRWKAGATRLVSTLQRVERPHALWWTGGTMGVRAIHLWRFEPRPGGAVASMEESFDGAVARLFRKRLQTELDETAAKGLQALKTAAEQSPRALCWKP